MLNRRDALCLTGLSLTAAGLAAACGLVTTTTTGGTTAVTIDTARVSTDASAVLTAISSILAAPSVDIALGTNLFAAQGALAAAQLALSQFEALTGPSVTVAIDTASAQTLVTSIVADVQQILSAVQAVVSKLSGPTATSVGNYVSAALTLIPLIQLAASLTTAQAAVKAPMTEAKAIEIATH